MVGKLISNGEVVEITSHEYDNKGKLHYWISIEGNEELVSEDDIIVKTEYNETNF